MSTRVALPIAGVLIAGATGLTALASPAAAASCSGAVRYASSSNTVYLTSGTASLSDIVAACPAAPIRQVDPSTHTWEISGDLVVQNGASLILHGTAANGDVDVLRLRSLASNAPTEVTAITAQYGTIDASNIHITSWDDAAQAPDTNPELPAGAPAGSRGRAFIRALSYLDTDGVTARESTMSFSQADVGYLGSYAAESYGVAYKARGCDADHLSVCAALNVYGAERNSRFHNNYMGTYTFDAYGMVFDHNEYDNNKMYGLDPHDDSDELTITNNHMHDNGDHGLICSQRCDHLTITGNESDHNGTGAQPAYQGPNADTTSDAQIHGIMLHRGITDSVVSGNYIHDNTSGSGLAIFDSYNDTVSNNTIVNNKYGIRVSVGSHDVAFSGDTVTSSVYGIFTYAGSDTATYSNPSGRPSDLTFSKETLNGASGNLVKLDDTDRITIKDSAVTGTYGNPLVERTSATLSNLTAPSSTELDVRGSSTVPGSVTVSPPTALNADLDGYSSVDVTSGAGQLAQVPAAVLSNVTPSGSTLHLTSATTGATGSAVGTNPFSIVPRPAAAVPSSGALLARPGFDVSPPHLFARGPSGAVSTSFTVGGLLPSRSYRVLANGAVKTTVTTDNTGTLRFTGTVSSSTIDYSFVVA